MISPAISECEDPSEIKDSYKEFILDEINKKFEEKVENRLNKIEKVRYKQIKFKSHYK